MPDYKILFERKNPFYAENEEIWRRSMLAYGGGKKYIQRALIKHLAEIMPEFKERLRRAYYLNYPRKIARLITQYVMSTRPERENADSDYVEDWNRQGQRVDEVIRQFSTFLNVCGSAWMIADMPAFVGEKTKEEEIAERLRPYALAVPPLSVPDWCYGDDGKLLWALVAEEYQDNRDPLTNPQTIRVRKLWQRDKLLVVRNNITTGEYTEEVIPHGLGMVPMIRHVEVDGYGINTNHWFEDAVRVSDAILNNESEAQMNTVKQMFGMLVIPEDFCEAIRKANQSVEVNSSPEEGYSSREGKGSKQDEKLSHVLARSAAIFESPNSKGISRYISPSGAETATIRSENMALRKELFEIVGLAVSKDGKAVESAEAKAWDFQNIQHFMETRADVLEQTEYRTWELMRAWNPNIPEPTIRYNRIFTVIELKESISALIELSSLNADNEVYQREVGKAAVALLNKIRQLSQDKQEEILDAIEKGNPVEAMKKLMDVERKNRNAAANVDNPPQIQK